MKLYISLALFLFLGLSMLSCKSNRQTASSQSNPTVGTTHTTETTNSTASNSSNSTVQTGNLTKDTTVIFKFEKTACFGRCPIYTFTVYGNYLAHFEGKNFTDKIGHFTKQYTKKEIDALIAAYVEAGFFTMKDEYNSLVQDLPSTIIYIKANGKQKRILDRVDGPETLRNLEKMTHEMVAPAEGWSKVENH